MRRRELVAAAAGAVVATVLAGSVAWAAIPGDGGVYSACMLKNVGTVRLIDKSLPSSNLMSRCTSLEVEVTWNKQGLQGVPGAQGTQGPKGDKGDPGAQGPTGPPGERGAHGEQGPQGIPGQPGPTGQDGQPGSVENSYQGQWSNTRPYGGGNLVTHDGSLWLAAQQTPANEEPGGSQFWNLLAGKGADGAAGSGGPPGPAGPKGDKGDTGSAGPQGPPGISGYEVKSFNGMLPLGPFQSFTFSMSCSPGKRVLGGGYYGARILADKDYPGPDDDRWVVAGSASATGGEIDVYAICANV